MNRSARCHNDVVVITGASMGIGEALARSFLSEGARVVMSSREMARLDIARQRVGNFDRTAAIACDVRDRSQIDTLVSKSRDAFGKIDVWVNNAGYGLQDSVISMSMRECRQM